ncbi:MAG TPA: endolytic transglycosylase MltG, partial [Solirubrobacterales bacterium]|nr:endolytic transglycosylase MltG [Solirubrobacterales bacterium]
GPPGRPRSNRRRLGVAAGLAIVFLGVAAIAALAYRHFHREDPPPPVVLRTITVTVPEGQSRAQTAALAREEGLRGSYEKASVRSRFLNPAKYGGAGAKDLEGFLFPDTFELEKHASAADLVQLQLEDFKRRIKGVDMGYARSKNLTAYDVLTIASMVEDEAGLASQRKLVAAVVYNRLHEGMPLGIDATTRFATGNYTKPLTESELAIDSPYNTRTNVGLPPGPINSPGLASIEAAAHPAKVDYLFYVAEPGACNKLAFSKTEAEFEADVARYNSAREEAGGNSPDSCGG